MTHSDCPLLVISPHLDDAVLSCGLVLAARPDAIICTAFTGYSGAPMSTDWDRASGFSDAQEAMSARKAEDRRALAILNAHPLHLPFCDAQYGASPTLDRLIEVIGQTVESLNPRTVLFPVGLFHSDHLLVADACLTVLDNLPGADFHAYEEVPYRGMDEVVQKRMIQLDARGWTRTAPRSFAAHVNSDPAYEWRKHDAIRAYRSQLQAFGPDGQAALFSTERYWQIRHDRHDTQ